MPREEATTRFDLSPNRNLFKTKCPTVDGGDVAEKAEEIRKYFHATFEIYEKVFDCLNSEESFLIKPVHKLRHPLIFYYAHTATFYINKLVCAGLTTRINPAFEEMFAIGVDEMSWDDLNEAHYSWPSIAEVTQYRRLVRERLDDMIRQGKFALQMPLNLANSTANEGNSFWWVVLMGIEHERIHLETASVHVRELPYRLVVPALASFWKRCESSDTIAPLNEMLEVAEGKVLVGRTSDSQLYGWDCDYSTVDNVHHVAAFKASKYLVSNAEFFAFMKADGYKERRFWDEEGWSWVTYRQPQHPWFWVRDENRPDGYALRLQTELIDLPWNWPCEINHLEARAFCNFKSETTGKKLRLPTEAEWLLLRDRFVKQDQHEWDRAPGNINLEHHCSSCPVDKYQHGPFFDVVGNVWQHTETPVYPYPGFRVQPYYDDFSMPTFDGRHTCIKGGTWVSTGNEATRDARYAFRRHFFQYTGVRYVEGVEVNEARHLCNVLGMDPEVDEVTDFAFRESFGPVRNAAVQVAELAKALYSKHGTLPARRALDLACGAGRASFELTSTFEEVVGSDFTARRLIPAFSIREKGNTQYSVLSSNGRVPKTVDASSFPWGATRERATFFQADPTNLHPHMTSFELIVAWNVLERSYKPTAVPLHLLSRLQRGGILLIGGHFDFARSTAPKEQHLQGTADELLGLLGGSTLVEALDNGAAHEVYAAYPVSTTSASLKSVRFFAFRKK